MVYIITKLWYPSHKTDEVQERYVEVLQKFPPDNSITEQVVPIAGRATKEGLEVMGVSLVKEGKFDEALTRIGGAMSMFSNIEGCEFSITVWATLQETQAMAA